MITVSAQVRRLPAAVRPTVKAAVEAVRAAAPDAEEVPYQMEAPRSDRTMWKIARYRLAGANVIGVGTFPRHSTIFFYRGRELDDGAGLLQGTGKDTRFVTVRSPEDVSSDAVRKLIARAIKLARG